MKKTFLIVAGIFLLIAGLSIITSWRIKKWEENLHKESLFKWEPLNLEQIKESLFSPSTETTQEIQEFISPDGNLKIEYPADWAAIKEKTILDALAPQEWAEKYNFQTLFLAQKIKGEKFAQLVAHKGEFNLTIEEIVEEKKKINQEQGWKIEIIKFDLKENEGTLEAEYLNPYYNVLLYAKEKFLVTEEKTYLITIFTFKKDWPQFKEEAEEILDSVQFVL